jgi:hypothetical protein
MRVKPAPLLCVGLLLASGCAQTSGGTAEQVAGPPGYPAAAAAQMLTAPRTVGQNIDLFPPAVGNSPVVTASDAYARCATEGVCYKGAAPSIQVAVITIPQVQAPDGGAITKRLAFVLTWSTEPCQGNGPGGSSPTTCTLTDFVDAQSGATLYSVESSNNP